MKEQRALSCIGNDNQYLTTHSVDRILFRNTWVRPCVLRPQKKTQKTNKQTNKQKQEQKTNKIKKINIRATIPQPEDTFPTIVFYRFMLDINHMYQAVELSMF